MTVTPPGKTSVKAVGELFPRFFFGIAFEYSLKVAF